MSAILSLRHRHLPGVSDVLISEPTTLAAVFLLEITIEAVIFQRLSMDRVSVHGRVGEQWRQIP